ncbi:MAG: hypothetical protein JW828_12545 [Sedimentisphaerales bacterium]|nr:hypothetical protein [Sedimentisphaerales bacterium]
MRMRTQFADSKGWSDLSLLKAPNKAEIDQLSRAVAIMTPSEKEQAAALTDEQVRRIADDARVDPALFAIFINGYVLACRRDGKAEDGQAKTTSENR